MGEMLIRGKVLSVLRVAVLMRVVGIVGRLERWNVLVVRDVHMLIAIFAVLILSSTGNCDDCAENERSHLF